MATKSKLNIPTLPEELDVVRSILKDHGISNWKETVVGAHRIDISCLVPREQNTKIILSIPQHVFALRGVIL